MEEVKDSVAEWRQGMLFSDPIRSKGEVEPGRRS